MAKGRRNWWVKHFFNVPSKCEEKWFLLFIFSMHLQKNISVKKATYLVKILSHGKEKHNPFHQDFYLRHQVAGIAFFAEEGNLYLFLQSQRGRESAQIHI